MTNTFTPEWIYGRGAESDIIITSRARLARSINGFPFPFKASTADLQEIANDVCSAARQIGKFRAVEIDKISVKARNLLVDAFIISPDFAVGGIGRVVLLDSRGKLSIMVNEEDHLRIQSMDSGLSISNIWDNINRLDDGLGQCLSYGFSEKLGFLTCSVTNLGTGLRLSAMMHLAALVHTGELAKHIKAANELGVSVRGLHGEGSKPLGDLFQVSNEYTLGMSEGELVDKVNSVAGFLLEAERKARKELIGDRPNTSILATSDDALRKLRYSQNIRAEKALSLLSSVRLGYETGIVKGCSREVLNVLLSTMGLHDRSFQAGVMRARMLHRLLKNAAIAV